MRKAREHAGLTQLAMAKVLGVNGTTVGRFESGSIPVRRAFLIAWAERCDVPLWWLAGEEPSSTKWYGSVVELRRAA